MKRAAGNEQALRHFLDLNELPTKELRNMLDASVAMKAKLKAHAKPAKAARRQDAGDDLREALDPHPGVVRRRHAPARRRTIMLTGAEMQLGRGETIADTARCCRAMSTPS
jgi:ornithine carbamoyltransferase